MEFLMYSHYVGTLEDWIERVQDGLKNEMRGGMFGNHGVDVDSMTVIQFEVCASNPCQNEGTCRRGYREYYYYCSCPHGYTGRNCELEKIELVISIHMTNLISSDMLVNTSSEEYQDLKHNVTREACHRRLDPLIELGNYTSHRCHDTCQANEACLQQLCPNLCMQAFVGILCLRFEAVFQQIRVAESHLSMPPSTESRASGRQLTECRAHPVRNVQVAQVLVCPRVAV
ncbi:hypothetical protein LSAT2_027436 [Lamellibrachia satsuma]|nr:hypothetical protein LSAT2_027436 [Lamellibrachia satsuma]